MDIVKSSRRSVRLKAPSCGDLVGVPGC